MKTKNYWNQLHWILFFGAPPAVGVLFFLYHLHFNGEILLGASVFMGILSGVLLIPIGWFIEDRSAKFERRQIDESWAYDEERKVLAETKRSLQGLTSLGRYNFDVSNTSESLRNRTFLLELVNHYESNKRLFLQTFEPYDTRSRYPKICQSFAQILAEFDDAITVLHQTLAEVEKKIRDAENAPKIGEKRGTPEFQNRTQTYVPPNQPDWD